jgi:phage-related protein (TIGR01555 family)
MSGVRADSLFDGLIGGCGGNMTGGGWSNPVTGMGTFGRDKVMQGSYAESYRIDDSQLAALYNGNDIAQRIINTKPREMFRRGWLLVVPQADDETGDPTSGSANGSGPGTESGPAAPGSPLVGPLGDPPDGVKPPVAPAGEKANISDPMGTTLAVTPPSNVQPKVPSAVKPPQNTPVQGKKSKGSAPTDQPAGAALAKNIEAYATRLGHKERFLEGAIFGRAYGGGFVIMGIDDGLDVAAPVDEANIRSIAYLTWIDRRFIFASTWYAEIGPKYGQVETWEIINPFGGQSNTRIHESRVIRFDGAPVDFLMRRRLLGWTLSVLQAPYDTMRQFDQSFQSIANLMADMSQAVMTINGLMQMISNDQATLKTRMQMVDMSRSSGRMVYLDAENEKFERVATPLTGVADTLEMQMLRLASAAEVPVAILFGREPSGLNATGDADFRRFYDTIAGEQRTILEPKLLRLYTLICLAKDSPTGGVMPARGLEFVWHKLYEPSELEQSTIRFNMAQADDLYINNGTLLPSEVALSRFRNGDLHLDTEIQTNLRTAALTSVQLAPEGSAKADAEAQQAKDLIKAKGDASPGAASGKPGAKPPAKAA